MIRTCSYPVGFDSAFWLNKNLGYDNEQKQNNKNKGSSATRQEMVCATNLYLDERIKLLDIMTFIIRLESPFLIKIQVVAYLAATYFSRKRLKDHTAFPLKNASFKQLELSLIQKKITS